MNVQEIVELKKAGLTVAEITEISASGLLKSKGKDVRKLSVNGQPFEDVTLESGLVVKAPSLHLEKDGDFIKFSAKGFKPRAVSVDDLKAGLADLEAHKVLKVSKAGVRFVARASAMAQGKERVLGENLILAAQNAGFLA